MTLTLKDIEAEGASDVQPFTVEISDAWTLTLPHPEDLPMGILLDVDINAPFDMLRVLMGEDAFDRLLDLKAENGEPRVTLRVLKTIMDKYAKHYGMGSLGEGNASRPSSNGSARRSKRTSQRRA